MFFKICVLKNFAIFTGKHLCWGLFLLRGYSYENSFNVVFPLNQEKDMISSCSYTKYFPAWARFILTSCLEGKFLEEPIFKMRDINVKKNGSVFCIWTYQRLILILYLVGVLYLLDTWKQHKNFMSSLPTSRLKMIVKIFSK